MFAAFIPLNPASQTKDTERNQSTSKLELQQDPHSQTSLVEDAVYRSALWWRTVNRGMSIIGLLVLAAVIALSVVGVKQRWGS